MGKIKTAEQRHEKMLERIRRFCLLDDDFMTKCFEENKEATELVLRIILKKTDFKIEKVITQYNMKNIKGRSLRLDIFATDASGKKYNIEIQREKKGAGAKRARYNSSLIDSNILPSGVDVDNLAETYVIFITETDVIGKDKPIYHIDRYIRETKELFPDGSHIIYVNAACQDNTELGKLMHDFLCTSPEDMNYTVLADAVRYYKEDREGISIMSMVMEDWMKDWAEEMAEEIAEERAEEIAEEKAEKKAKDMAEVMAKDMAEDIAKDIAEDIAKDRVIDEKKGIALRMVGIGKLSLEEIAQYLNLPLEEVEKLTEKEMQPV